MTPTEFKNTLFKPANYIHNNGDREEVVVLGYDNDGRAWVKWTDGFINMISVDRLEFDL